MSTERMIRIFVMTVWLFLIATPLHAHRLNTFAWVENGKIEVESYFASGSPCKACELTVKNEQGKTLHKGQTDAEGRYGFSLHTDSDLIITVSAGMGHQGSARISKAELPAPPKPAAAPKQPPAKSGPPKPPKPKADKPKPAKPQTVKPEKTVKRNPFQAPTSEAEPTPAAAAPAPDEAAIKKLIQSEVAEQTRESRDRIRRMERDDKVTAKDVLAGLGFIFGLAALLTVTLKRRRESGS